MKRKIIIDTDPGQDDAVAILLALASPDELDVLAVVAVAGNVGLAQNAKNALKVVELSGRAGVPVYAGSVRPMRRQLLAAEHGSITLCTLGPLTNVAMALVKEPAIVRGIGEIVMMGGGYFEVGNITPAAEFNIFVDPEAADVVLRCGARITMIPLDVTHGVLSTRPRLDRILALGNRAGDAVNAMLSFSERFDLGKYGEAGAPLHDPCVIAWLLKPDLFEGRQINVSVETQSELTRGLTVADWWRITDRPRNVFYLRRADANGFYALLTERLARLP